MALMMYAAVGVVLSVSAALAWRAKPSPPSEDVSKVMECRAYPGTIPWCESAALLKERVGYALGEAQRKSVVPLFTVYADQRYASLSHRLNTLLDQVEKDLLEGAIISHAHINSINDIFAELKHVGWDGGKASAFSPILSAMKEDWNTWLDNKTSKVICRTRVLGVPLLVRRLLNEAVPEACDIKKSLRYASLYQQRPGCVLCVSIKDQHGTLTWDVRPNNARDYEYCHPEHVALRLMHVANGFQFEGKECTSQREERLKSWDGAYDIKKKRASRKQIQFDGIVSDNFGARHRLFASDRHRGCKAKCVRAKVRIITKHFSLPSHTKVCGSSWSLVDDYSKMIDLSSGRRVYRLPVVLCHPFCQDNEGLSFEVGFGEQHFQLQLHLYDGVSMRYHTYHFFLDLAPSEEHHYQLVVSGESKLSDGGVCPKIELQQSGVAPRHHF